ncbi:MAG: hypothetical protein ACTSU5_06020 [Promethearchaeota archaeon]
MVVPYEEYDQTQLFWQAIAQLVACSVFLIIDAIIWKKYKDKRIKEVGYLASSFLLLGSAIIVGTIPQVFCLYDRSADLIFGVPLGGGRHLWWTNLSMALISVSNVCVFRFIQLIFLKPKKGIFHAFLAANVVFSVWDIYEGIFLYEPGNASMSLPLSSLFLLITLYLWATLYRLAMKDARKLEDKLYRTGMRLVGLSGLFMIISYVLWIVNLLFKEARVFGVFYWVFYTSVALLMYVGYILPKWFRGLVESDSE